VQCGYGDDAHWLAARGCAVTAFDISPTAVAAAENRFPPSPVVCKVADLLDLRPHRDSLMVWDGRVGAPGPGLG
jgi:2-polyprenyl-3-methyl-5-hydroxy-6-metoxy-1,4-benzoquinol methylase